MSAKIKFRYQIKNIENRFFITIIPRDATVREVLELISQKRKETYKTLFYDDSVIDEDDSIIDYIDADQEYYFCVSLNYDLPTQCLDQKQVHKPQIPPPKPSPKVPPPKPSPKVLAPIVRPPMANAYSHNTPQIMSVAPQTENERVPAFKETDISTFQELVSTKQIGILNEKYERYSIKTSDIRSKKKFLFYCTGGDKNLLLNGINVELSLSMDVKQCKEELLKYLKDKINLLNKQLLVYLPGGLPFNKGKIGDIFTKEELKMKNIIYGVIIRALPEEFLCKKCFEACNVKDQDHKNIISPLVDSTDRGLSDMACLIGYINHDGNKSDLLLRSSSAIIHFAPFITSMKRIIEREANFKDIVTVTSTFYTFFRAILPLYCPDNKVLEYTILLCSLISYIENPPEEIPLVKIETKEKISTLFPFLEQFDTIYFWKGDANENFKWLEIDIRIDDAIENADNIFTDFTPIEPLSMKKRRRIPLIVKGKTHEYLYLCESPCKDSNSKDKVNIIDPMIGNVESKNFVAFTNSQKDQNDLNIPNIINPGRVKQIIVVNLDESESMYADLNGNDISSKNYEIPRITIAYQLLNTFIDKLYYNNISSIQSIVSFSDKFIIDCPFTSTNPNSAINCLKKSVSKSASKLWDSLSFSCNEIVKYRKDDDGKEIFNKAVSRILVISAGNDQGSSSKVHQVVKNLIKNKIVVDGVILNTVDQCKTLCSVCHATGGLCFRPESIEKCIGLFEQSAFFNIDERMNDLKPLIIGDNSTLPSCLKPDQITKDFMNYASRNAKFDVEVSNKILIKASENAPLVTPASICSKFKDTLIPNLRRRRILKELHYAALCMNKDEVEYDPDLKIYIFQSNIEIWRVFINKSKWLHLLIQFPEFYPFQPPIVKFVTAPYNLNISNDGQVCIDELGRKYLISDSIIHIIHEIRLAFFLACENTPITNEFLDIYKNEHDRYSALVEESIEANDINDINDFIKSYTIVDEANYEDLIISDDQNKKSSIINDEGNQQKSYKDE